MRQAPTRCGLVSKPNLIAAVWVLESNTYYNNLTVQDGYGHGPSVASMAENAGLHKETMRDAVTQMLHAGMLRENQELGRQNHHEFRRPARLLEWDLEEIEGASKAVLHRLTTAPSKAVSRRSKAVLHRHGAAKVSRSEEEDVVIATLGDSATTPGDNALSEDVAVKETKEAEPGQDSEQQHPVAEAHTDNDSQNPLAKTWEPWAALKWPAAFKEAWKAAQKRHRLLDDDLMWPDLYFIESDLWVVLRFRMLPIYERAAAERAAINALLDKHMPPEVQGWTFRLGYSGERDINMLRVGGPVVEPHHEPEKVEVPGEREVVKS
jgi:hypothetical protein